MKEVYSKMPEELLDQLDDYAEERYLNRSAAVRQIVAQEVQG